MGSRVEQARDVMIRKRKQSQNLLLLEKQTTYKYIICFPFFQQKGHNS